MCIRDRGYITRVVSPKDRRQYGLYPTEKTRRAHHAVRMAEAEWEAYMTRNLSSAEKETLDSLLEKLLRDMEMCIRDRYGSKNVEADARASARH